MSYILMVHSGRIFAIVSNIIIDILQKQSNLIQLGCLIYLRGERNQKNTFISVTNYTNETPIQSIKVKNTYLSTLNNCVHCFPLTVPKGLDEGTCAVNKIPLPSSYPHESKITQRTINMCLPVSRPFPKSSYLQVTLSSLGKPSSVRWNNTF